MLKISDLTFSYPNREVFKDSSLLLSDIGFHALFGPSGVGKSTLAKIIASMNIGGNVSFDVLPNRILYCHNKERIPLWQTVAQHFKDIVSHEKRSLLNDLLVEFSIDDSKLFAKPNELSTGESNRINLLRYLLQDFDLLIMDEVLSGVDEKTRDNILSYIKRAFDDKSFIYISHDVKSVVVFCKEIIVLWDLPVCGEIKILKGMNMNESSEVDYGKFNECVQCLFRH